MRLVFNYILSLILPLDLTHSAATARVYTWKQEDILDEG